MLKHLFVFKGMLKYLFALYTTFGAYSSFSNPLLSQKIIDPEAQTTINIDSVKEEVQSKVLVLLKAGLNLSNMNFKKGYHPDADHIDPSWKIGYFVGTGIQIPLPRRFFLRQEYVLSRTRGEIYPLGVSYTFDYLSMPVLLGYSIHKRFSIFTGPQFELLIAGKESSGGKVHEITKNTEERSVGWSLGLQYFVDSKLFLEAKFMHGINAIGINQRTNRNEFRFELFQISGNYTF